MNKYTKILQAVSLTLVLCFTGSGSFAAGDTYTREQVAALRESAVSGDSDAQFQLGTLYQQGDSVVQNDREAVKWYRLAADQNNADAQFALGFAYRGGFGVPTSLVQSYMWFDIATARGNEEAPDVRSTVAELMSYDEITEARKASKKWQADHPLTPKKGRIFSFF